MSLKELSDENRIFFLLDFIGEIVINSARDEKLKNLIKSEKIKRKYLEQEREIELSHITKTKAFNNKEYEESEFQRIAKKEEVIKPVRIQGRVNRNRSNMRINQLVGKNVKPEIGADHSGKVMTFPAKESMSKPVSVSLGTDPLGKISTLIKDSNIQLIECPGPGKNLLVKSRNRINLTKISLSEQDIEGIVNHFANESRIPVMNGILKAAIGDLIISAVVSQFVGSRFIITKKSPYSLIEGINQNI